MICRYCLDDNLPFLLIDSACSCKGTSASVHLHCLLRWIVFSSQGMCGVCKDVFLLPYAVVEAAEVCFAAMESIVNLLT